MRNTPMQHTTGPDLVGHLAKNWGFSKGLTGSPVQLNPQATPADLLGWCYGEAEFLSHMVVLMTQLSSTSTEGDAELLVEMLGHRIHPLRDMLKHVTGLLWTVERNSLNSDS